jgi:hypothetical protein
VAPELVAPELVAPELVAPELVTPQLVAPQLVCGRDPGFPGPPAQIPASGLPALGSCLGSEGKA